MTTTTYPGAIARACAALDEAPQFREMPDGYLRVVLRLVKKINLARLAAPIVASRGTLAAESGKSIETVGRVLRWLEDQGLVQRTQKARPGLRGSESPVVPTPKLLEALTLTGHVDKVKASPVTADGSISVPRKQSFGKQSAAPGLCVRIEGKTLPADLAGLCQQGIKATGVLALMRDAKKAGQRLSDVVQATRQYLDNLSGQALYAYLRKLISKDKDYGRQVAETAKEQQADQARQRLGEKAEALRGRRFQNRDGTERIEVLSNGLLAIDGKGRRYTCQINEAFLDALEAGRIRPICTDPAEIF